MFAQENRLAKDRDVQAVFRAGRTFFDPQITIKSLRRPGATTARFTVVVSTKVSKLAVRRNRIKRVVREFLRLHISALGPADFMIIVRPSVARFTPAELRGSIERVLRKSGLLKAGSL